MSYKLSKGEILSYLKLMKPEWNERFGVCKVGLFGSFFHGNQDKNDISNIDVIVDFYNDEFNKTARDTIKEQIRIRFNREVEMCPTKHIRKKFPDEYEKIKGSLF